MDSTIRYVKVVVCLLLSLSIAWAQKKKAKSTENKFTLTGTVVKKTTTESLVIKEVDTISMDSIAKDSLAAYDINKGITTKREKRGSRTYEYYIDKEGKDLMFSRGKRRSLRTMFNVCNDFKYGYGLVKRDGEGYNYVGTDGRYIPLNNPRREGTFNIWFKKGDNFDNNGVTTVTLENGKRSYVRISEGGQPELISVEGFDTTENYTGNLIKVERNGYYNIVDEYRRYTLSVWMSDIGSLVDGVAIVERKRNVNLLKTVTEYNIIDDRGKLLSTVWFDACSRFVNGYAKVRIDGRYSYINKEGHLITMNLFRTADNFDMNHYAKVETYRYQLFFIIFKRRYGYIDGKGRLLTKKPIM